MFNGVPEQYHQFIASRTALPLSLPLPLPPHVSPPTFSTLDLHPSHHQVFQSHHLLHQLHFQSSMHQDEEKEEEGVVRGSIELQGVGDLSEQMDLWPKEEVLALLRIRSSIGNSYSDFIWEHVSRKLAELGFKRSADKCKDKFEEVSNYCNNSTSYGTNYRSFCELKALFEDQNCKSLAEKMVRTNEGRKVSLNLEDSSGNETLENPNPYVAKNPTRKKRKRHHKLELLKGFCEQIVTKIMAQQEELHKKLIEDVERREEERVAREEAWKKKEMDRINKEIEKREQEQAIACDRDATIIEFLKKFTSSSPSQNLGLVMKNEDLESPNYNPNPNPNSVSRVPTPNSPNVPTSATIVLQPESPSSITTQTNPNAPTSSTIVLATQNLNCGNTQNNPKIPISSTTQDLSSQNPSSITTQNPNSTFSDREDSGKRWPRDEVYSLINLRCNLYNNGEDKESTKVPLWERISQGMLELGYKRSAKKCKEKWENINKYFRKTKDANKKRSLDSKTCPYFHQLSSLYTQGTLMLPSEGPEIHSSSPENCSAIPETRLESCPGGFSKADVQVDENERNMVQVSSLEFEY